MTFAELLAHYDLQLDARDFTFVGRWVTPPFSPRRFDTWFFLVNCPPKQEPQTADGELLSGEWIDAREAVALWERSAALVAPPVLHALRTLAGGLTDDLVARFLDVPQAQGQPVRRIEFLPGFICFPLRTPTKPPATHTNCYLVGGREIVIIDPASPDEGEQRALADCLDDLLREGRRVREMILTHHHPDHVGGVAALRAHLEAKIKSPIDVAAHRLTAATVERERNDFAVTRYIEDGETIKLEGAPPLVLRALHTPGHTRGHLCFYEERTGALLTGDVVVGVGSVLIDPPEGDMRDYLASLRRLRTLPKLKALFGGHGPAVGNPVAKIDEYIAHREAREQDILAAVRAAEAPLSSPEIVARVYTDVPPQAHGMAARAVLAHLEKLETEGFVRRGSDAAHFTAVRTG
jgi:glyoxylase-like metal-dependent hydrolase (beta-lactamase superfamily II)